MLWNLSATWNKIFSSFTGRSEIRLTGTDLIADFIFAIRSADTYTKRALEIGSCTMPFLTWLIVFLNRLLYPIPFPAGSEKGPIKALMLSAGWLEKLVSITPDRATH